MQRVVVTVQREGEAHGRDLEVPAEASAERLAELIAAAWPWSDNQPPPVACDLEVRSLGRRLAAGESLVSAGVWDGAWLILTPAPVPAPVSVATPAPAPAPVMAPLVTPAPDPAPALATPVFAWRPLDLTPDPDAPAWSSGPSAPEAGPDGAPDDTAPSEPAAPAERSGTGFVWKQLPD